MIKAISANQTCRAGFFYEFISQFIRQTSSDFGLKRDGNLRLRKSHKTSEMRKKKRNQDYSNWPLTQIVSHLKA